MTHCQHLPAIELAHDGRLDEAAREALTEHVRGCEPCRAHRAALAALRTALDALPVPPSDAASIRRGRASLLEAATNSPTRTRTFALAGLAATGVVGLVLAFGLHGREHAAATSVMVRGDRAVWSRHDEAGTTLVRLEDGELELQVAHGASPHRLVVSLPDGELDDLGTTFRVTVAHARTSEVAVREGAVVLRLVGRPPVFLVANERWVAPPLAVTEAVPIAPPPPVRVPAGTAASAPRREVQTPAPAPVPPRPPPSSVATEFATAVRLFEDGKLAEAAGALRDFVSRHESDPHTEDARYLLVLALQRTGDLAAARDAASIYLERYPHGFRRAEVEELAR